MPQGRLARFTLLPELELTDVRQQHTTTYLKAMKVGSFEVCPKCATRSKSIYDRRIVSVKDAPIRGKLIVLEILKRRFWCKPCARPFTEPIAGISKGQRSTARYRRELLWACENFTDLKRVRRALRCSYSLIYKVLYEQLELRQRMRVNYPWPEKIGIDEHSFKRNRRYGYTEFATVVVDHKNKRVFDLVEGRSSSELRAGLSGIKGRENVKQVSLDLSSSYRSFY